jgi:hypothetical protein
MHDDRTRIQMFDQRGQVVEVEVETDAGGTPPAVGAVGVGVAPGRALWLDGERLRMLDDQTCEVVRTGQRLSTHPPMSGG